MKAALVLAVVSFCYGPSCDTKQLLIERKACGARFVAKLPLNGEWTPAIVSVRCQKGSTP